MCISIKQKPFKIGGAIVLFLIWLKQNCYLFLSNGLSSLALWLSKTERTAVRKVQYMPKLTWTDYYENWNGTSLKKKEENAGYRRKLRKNEKRKCKIPSEESIICIREGRSVGRPCGWTVYDPRTVSASMSTNSPPTCKSLQTNCVLCSFVS